MTDDIALKRMGITEELESGDVGITSVDCTPRAPRREGYISDAQHQRAQELFRKSQAGLELELRKLGADNHKKNRMAALQPVVYGAHGEPLYFTQCACKWHGLRVSDPEVARREYDAHACSLVDADGMWQPGQTGRRDERNAWSKPGWAAQTKAMLVAQPAPGIDEQLRDGVAAVLELTDDTPVVVTTEVDGTEQRMKLLELK